MSTNYRSLIESRKREIRKVTRGYDSTLKLSGKSSLTNILDRLDENTSYNLELARSEVTRILRLAAMVATRTKNKRLSNFLDDNNTSLEIWGTIRNYGELNGTLFVINLYDIEAFNNINLDGTDKISYICSFARLGKNNSFKQFNIVCDNMLYHVLLEDINEDNVRVQLSVMYGDTYIPEACYTYTVDTLPSEKTGTGLTVICSNTKCAYYKASLGRSYDDGSKKVSCSVEDCEKCSAFTDVLRPNELLTACEAIAYAYINKKVNKTKTEVVNIPDYQPLPLPESDRDVIIYIKDLNKEDEHDNNTGHVKIRDYGEDYIPSTHASPREHMRSECIVHYKSGKIGKRKACIVNKGKNKTTYVVKASNGLANKKKLKTKNNISVNMDYLKSLLDE